MPESPSLPAPRVDRASRQCEGFHVRPAHLARDQNAEAVGPRLQDPERILVCSIIPNVQTQHPLPISQAQGPQEMSQRTPLVPVHLVPPPQASHDQSPIMSHASEARLACLSPSLHVYMAVCNRKLIMCRARMDEPLCCLHMTACLLGKKKGCKRVAGPDLGADFQHLASPGGVQGGVLTQHLVHQVCHLHSHHHPPI